MARGRRAVELADASAWVFNRMADVYDARPAYPSALIDALAALTTDASARVLDVGAGTGHLALPLAQRGYDVTAVEPAQAMLERLEHNAAERGLTLRALHATAEALPVADGSVDLVVISDALHFIDAERAGLEVARVLAAHGTLAVVRCELGDTPFMRGVVDVMESAAPRKPRSITAPMMQLASLVNVVLDAEQRFEDATALDDATLERILRSISFIGPAMSPQRFDAFFERVLALPGPRLWARTFTLRAGRRR
jgi:ubiquinone/menaquinone biosynthesis C-methylase UbiE